MCSHCFYSERTSHTATNVSVNDVDYNPFSRLDCSRSFATCRAVEFQILLKSLVIRLWYINLYIYSYQAFDELFTCSPHLVGDAHRQITLHLRHCRIVISFLHLAFVTDNPLQRLQQLQDEGVGEFPLSVHEEILPSKGKEQSNSVLLSKMKEQNKY